MCGEFLLSSQPYNIIADIESLNVDEVLLLTDDITWEKPHRHLYNKPRFSFSLIPRMITQDANAFLTPRNEVELKHLPKEKKEKRKKRKASKQEPTLTSQCTKPTCIQHTRELSPSRHHQQLEPHKITSSLLSLIRIKSTGNYATMQEFHLTLDVDGLLLHTDRRRHHIREEKLLTFTLQTYLILFFCYSNVYPSWQSRLSPRMNIRRSPTKISQKAEIPQAYHRLADATTICSVSGIEPCHRHCHHLGTWISCHQKIAPYNPWTFR